MRKPETSQPAPSLLAAFLLGDAAIGAWLGFAFGGFTDQGVPLLRETLFPALATALLALLFGLHRSPVGRRGAFLARLAGLALTVAGLAALATSRKWLHASPSQALWLGAALALLLWTFRQGYGRLGGSRLAKFSETVRWVVLGLVATVALYPFYFSGSIGSGDAHWYGLMLSDFVRQLRSGAFPVWAGQSIYAFNGAVSPLRYAPGFQYCGGILDLLTGRSLEPMALKNLCLCFSALAGAYSAYLCLRPIVRSSPWLACLLSVLWIAGPGVLAPVTSGDQYMTYMALAFVPIAFHGCWSVWEHDDAWGRFLIGAALAALWLCHSPVALWMTFLCAGIYIPIIVVRRGFAREALWVALMAFVFLSLGSLPFVSILTLDNQVKIPSVGLSAAQEVHHYFPANFKPIDVMAAGALPDYQIGYALLFVLALTLALLPRSGSRVALAFAIAALAVVPWCVPVPWLTNALWSHVPVWFVTINNVWPMQRLFLILSCLIVFAGAMVLGSSRVSGRALARAVLVAVLACSGVWSGLEANKLLTKLLRTRSSPAQTRIMEGPDNILLTRYAYSSFASAPGYASHAYMEPWFENRLLDRQTHEAFLANADAAAPGDMPGPGAAGHSDLVQKGTLTAENITQSSSYFLRPALALDPGKYYALRLEFTEPIASGVLQLMHESMFREYLLPDSGVGLERRGPPRAFGTAPTSSRVIPLKVAGTGPINPTAILITDRPTHADFAAARFWLYAYDRARLPIRVTSWIPYRAELDSPREAFLETPRVWLKGWRARVNGAPVRTERSPDNLVMIPVPSGPSRVTLLYQPPWVLSVSFWVGLVGWFGIAATGLYWLFRDPPLPPAPV